MQEWLQKYEAELSKSGRVLEPRGSYTWTVDMLDCWDVPWFQEQVLVKEPYIGGPNWRGFSDVSLLNEYSKVQQQIVEVDGLSIAWEVGWMDDVRHWSSNWFKPYQVLGKTGIVSTGAVRDIHMHW